MKINNIINEEIGDFINETYVMQNDDLRFSQEIKNSRFNNYENFSNDFDVEINESNIIINWKIGFWVNNAGIENFIIQIENVQGNYIVVLRDKHTDAVSQENNKNIENEPWKFQIDNAVLNLGGSLYVSTLSFDFQSKICMVSFT